MADLLYKATMTFATTGGTWPANQVRRIPVEDVPAWQGYMDDGTIVAAGAAPSEPDLPEHSFGDTPEPVDVTPPEAESSSDEPESESLFKPSYMAVVDPVNDPHGLDPKVIVDENADPPVTRRRRRGVPTPGSSAGAGQPTVRVEDPE